MAAGTTVTKEAFIARLERLYARGETAELVRFSRSHIEEVLPQCVPEEAELIDGLMGFAHRHQSLLAADDLEENSRAA